MNLTQGNQLVRTPNYAETRGVGLSLQQELVWGSWGVGLCPVADNVTPLTAAFLITGL